MPKWMAPVSPNTTSRRNGGLSLRGRFGSINDPDGICLDADGATWVASFTEDAFVRIDRTGVERKRITVSGRRALACALGGADRRTLFCLSAETSYEELRKGRSASRIDVVEVGSPGDGYP
ncbi:sugar lactone lactonase YvrE [Bradyrhizobium sp. USDA 4538]|nr:MULTISPECIES: SMP-30/gluconolactonase/LRE family protein [unclassified Bradyrhizobium]MCP1844359.1 sugar lactone lactonase YvrE [Bradyrhizobium sp. USDA 4538]MCP1904925.1 sugar lactone lactonase YvrE [Bradyrhizobium sp. USDA 4537]MCP1989419.1 sugar lactone lactonase YvrE [Bradyrhizobium sp. USDA 4539]